MSKHDTQKFVIPYVSTMDRTFDYVIYHAPCSDGYCSAFIAHLQNKDATFVGLEPRNPFPDQLLTTLQNKRVIMMDIAFPRETMIQLHKVASKFIILDHHETSQEALKGLDFAQFDMNRSGCMMAWDYFFPDKPIPDFIRYIGLRDLWKHKDNLDALYFTTSFPGEQTFEAFNRYYTDPGLVHETIQKGKVQHDYTMQLVKQISSKAYNCPDWHGYPTKVVNCGWPLSSDVGDWLSENNPDCVVLLWTKQVGEPYTYSLRSNNPKGPNVATISKTFYKGGGHAHASGFKSDLSPDQLIKKSTL